MLPLARIALALLVLLQAACTLSRSSVPPHPASAPIRQVLPNGVRVLVEEHRTSDVVALQLWVAAGGRDETANELGLAHYLEHMLFKGTSTRPGGFINDQVEGVGGRMNAGTSYDYTNYHMVLPAGRALSGIETLADISVNAALDERHLEREKQVVLEEMRLGEDNPNRFLFRQLYESVFDHHPYGRPIIGRPELIRSLTRDQLVSFYRRHYIPESFALVVVGAVDPGAVMETARRTFGRLPRSGSGRLPVAPPPTKAGRNVELVRPGAHAYLGFAWQVPRLDHGDTPAIDLLVTILGQGRTSRLMLALRERLGLVNSISSGYSPLEGAGMVWITAQLEPAGLARAQAEIVNEIQRLRTGGITEAERERALTAEESRREFRDETAEGRALALGRAETIWRVDDELAYLHRLRSVTTAELRVAARRYLDPERFTRVIFKPSGPETPK